MATRVIREAYKVLADYESYRQLLEVVRAQVHNPSPEDLSERGWLATMEQWNSEVPLRNKQAAEALMWIRNNSVPFTAQARAKVGT